MLPVGAMESVVLIVELEVNDCCHMELSPCTEAADMQMEDGILLAASKC